MIEINGNLNLTARRECRELMGTNRGLSKGHKGLRPVFELFAVTGADQQTGTGLGSLGHIRGPPVVYQRTVPLRHCEGLTIRRWRQRRHFIAQWDLDVTARVVFV